MKQPAKGEVIRQFEVRFQPQKRVIHSEPNTRTWYSYENDGAPQIATCHLFLDTDLLQLLGVQATNNGSKKAKLGPMTVKVVSTREG